MKKIAIVANDVAMPGEKGLSRLQFFGSFLQKNGYEVEIITADFQHWMKRYRTKEEMEKINREAGCKVTFIHEPPYTKNIDLKRFFSYIVLTKNTKKYLEQNKFDLVYALIPDNHLAATAGSYAKKCGIPFVVDIEDLWPEAMKMILDVPVVSDVLFSSFAYYAKKTYKAADAVVGLTEAEAKEMGIPVKVGKHVMFGNAKTVIADPGRCFMKLVAHAETRELVGAQLMCEHASDMIGGVAQALANHLTAEQFCRAMRPHPSFEEAMTAALEDLCEKLG